jgi:hypothetical protein
MRTLSRPPGAGGFPEGNFGGLVNGAPMRTICPVSLFPFTFRHGHQGPPHQGDFGSGFGGGGGNAFGGGGAFTGGHHQVGGGMSGMGGGNNMGMGFQQQGFGQQGVGAGMGMGPMMQGQGGQMGQ